MSLADESPRKLSSVAKTGLQAYVVARALEVAFGCVVCFSIVSALYGRALDNAVRGTVHELGRRFHHFLPSVALLGVLAFQASLFKLVNLVTSAL